MTLATSEAVVNHGDREPVSKEGLERILQPEVDIMAYSPGFNLNESLDSLESVAGRQRN